MTADSAYKLFVCYVGGSTATARIELHDVQFYAAQKLEDGFDYLKKQWWGIPASLHLDCWGALEQADGFDIVLKKTPPAAGAPKLWFVNLGGYQPPEILPQEFSELHKNVFVVAATQSKAQVRALKSVTNWDGRHKDEIFDVEHMTCLDDTAAMHGLYIHLVPLTEEKPFAFECGYWPIGKNKPRTS